MFLNAFHCIFWKLFNKIPPFLCHYAKERISDPYMCPVKSYTFLELIFTSKYHRNSRSEH